MKKLFYTAVKTLCYTYMGISLAASIFFAIVIPIFFIAPSIAGSMNLNPIGIVYFFPGLTMIMLWQEVELYLYDIICKGK